MPDDVARARRRLILAIFLVFTVVGTLAAAFYFLDGISVVDDVLAGRLPWDAADPDALPEPPVEPTSTIDALEGIPDELIARVWQEQVDSQRNIVKLLSGEVTGLSIGAVALEGDLATLEVVAEFADGTSAPGVLMMRRVAGVWLLASAQGMREPTVTGSAASVGATGSVGQSPLPAMSEVDTRVVATILGEQRESQATIQEYLSGRVLRIDVLDVVDGPNTKTLKIAMTEDHEVTRADIICISTRRGGEALWFITRFEKTGSTPK